MKIQKKADAVALSLRLNLSRRSLDPTTNGLPLAGAFVQSGCAWAPPRLFIVHCHHLAILAQNQQLLPLTVRAIFPTVTREPVKKRGARCALFLGKEHCKRHRAQICLLRGGSNLVYKSLTPV